MRSACVYTVCITEDPFGGRFGCMRPPTCKSRGSCVFWYQPKTRR
nr:MAG TPA: hypothetical protein [Caudoviricetes sp.]